MTHDITHTERTHCPTCGVERACPHAGEEIMEMREEIERLRKRVAHLERELDTEKGRKHSQRIQKDALRARLERAIEPVDADSGKSNLDTLIRIENNMEPMGRDFEELGEMIARLRGEA